MRLFATTIAAALLLAIVAGCVPQRVETAATPAHPNPIVVREFAFSPGVVSLDPSFGFSLYRGAPGVPPRQRADAVGRAAAFTLADAVADQLRKLGYDAVRVSGDAPEPGGRALIVGGVFRHIDEGRRRQNASVDVAVEIDYRPAGAALQRLTTFDLDSRRLPREPLAPAAGRHGDDVNFAATRVGGAIGRYVADLARVNRWPGAAR